MRADVAASAFGRDLLMSKDCGRRVVDVFLAAIYNVPPTLAARLKKYAPPQYRVVLHGSILCDPIQPNPSAD